MIWLWIIVSQFMFGYLCQSGQLKDSIDGLISTVVKSLFWPISLGEIVAEIVETYKNKKMR